MLEHWLNKEVFTPESRWLRGVFGPAAWSAQAVLPETQAGSTSDSSHAHRKVASIPLNPRECTRVLTGISVVIIFVVRGKKNVVLGDLGLLLGVVFVLDFLKLNHVDYGLLIEWKFIKYMNGRGELTALRYWMELKLRGDGD